MMRTLYYDWLSKRAGIQLATSVEELITKSEILNVGHAFLVMMT